MQATDDQDHPRTPDNLPGGVPSFPPEGETRRPLSLVHNGAAYYIINVPADTLCFFVWGSEDVTQ